MSGYAVLREAVLSAAPLTVGADETPPASAPVAAAVAPDGPSFQTRRMAGYSFVHPLLSCEPISQDAGRLRRVRAALAASVTAHVAVGGITRAAVYLIDLESAGWVGVEPDHRFPIGALDRLIWLLALFSREDRSPGFILGPASPGSDRPLGRDVDDMLARDDEAARRRVAKAVGSRAYTGSLTDLGLSTKPGTGVSAREMARVFQVLYDASYLAEDTSDAALALLNRHGPDGGRALTADDVPAARLQSAGPGHLHDCGVVFLRRRPYIRCVLTEGPDPARLRQVVDDLCRQTLAGMRAVRL